MATADAQRFAFNSVIIGISGLALTIIGLIAVTGAGVDGPMNEPVVKVLGFTHTATHPQRRHQQHRQATRRSTPVA